MAIRIHVTAVRNGPPAEVRSVMSEVIRPACAGSECPPVGDQLDVHEHGGWSWFTTSVWGVSAGDLNRGLCKLARPALQFTTSDGDRWYLSVHGGPHGQVHFLHEFAYQGSAPSPESDAEYQARLEAREEPPPMDPRLAFLEEDPSPVPHRPKAPFDLVADSLNEMGACIPDDFREAVAHLPYSAAMNRYRDWHVEQILRALTEAVIPHDAAGLRSVLLWENITENESGSDLGNLPRLLSVLGLGGQWDDWVLQAEAPPSPPEPEPEPEPAAEIQDEAAQAPDQDDHFGPVLAIVEPLGLTPVDGGPFPLPLKELTRIGFFVEALSIHSTAGVVLTVTFPPDFDRSGMTASAGIGVVAVEPTQDGFRVGIQNHVWFNRSDLKEQLGARLAKLLDHLPDGSALDLAFAFPDQPAPAKPPQGRLAALFDGDRPPQGLPALTQRYRGRVADGAWQISESYPTLSREALAGGLDLARYAAKEPEKHELRDDAEAEAVVELAGRDPTLWDMRVQRKGRTVWCKSDVVGHLPKVIFRHRFAARWDVAAHDREAARLHKARVDMQRKMRRAGVEAARRRAAPHDDEVLFRGRLGPYWRSDFTRIEELEQDTRERFDSALESLGFRRVGDLVAKKQRDIVLRAFASGDGFSLGLLLAKKTMYLGFEFFSRFADGSTLSTTTNAAVASRPEFQYYAKTHPGLEPAALYAKHRWGIERFRTRKGTEPVRLDPTLLGVAREYDRALARREGVSLRFRILSPPPGQAPPHIRAAWVGCVLPLYTTSDDPKVPQKTKGRRSSRDEGDPPGFVVHAVDAIAVLDRHNAEAAQWWRQNMPHVIKPGQLFVYPGTVCELVDELATPGSL
jgi:hypothetical protein